MLASELDMQQWPQRACAAQGGGALPSESEGSPSKRPRMMQLGGNLEVPDDGFMWLKYGQKHIRGTQHQRNYYRCSMFKVLGCPAKKTVDFRKSNPAELRITDSHVHNHPRRTIVTMDQGPSQTDAPMPPMGRALSSDARSIDTRSSSGHEGGHSKGGNLPEALRPMEHRMPEEQPVTPIEADLSSSDCEKGKGQTASDLKHWGQALHLGFPNETLP